MRKSIGTVKNEKLARKQRRKLSIRKKIIGTTERPRICTVRSNKHISVQVVCDDQNKTLFSLSTFGKTAVKGSSNTKEGAAILGKAVAEKLKENKIEIALFDRNGSAYMGVMKSLADAIRENGIRI